MRHSFIVVLCFMICCSAFSQTNSPSPIIPEADGFIVIKDAKMQPDKNKIYKAVYDATKVSRDSTKILPALNNAGAVLNDLGVCGIPVNHAKFVIVFHGASVDGIRDNQHYKEKYGIDNPNLKVLTELKKAGVQLFVCGQYLLGENIDFKTISPDVSIASDALIVLLTFQNEGYALMNF